MHQLPGHRVRAPAGVRGARPGALSRVAAGIQLLRTAHLQSSHRPHRPWTGCGGWPATASVTARRPPRSIPSSPRRSRRSDATGLGRGPSSALIDSEQCHTGPAFGARAEIRPGRDSSSASCRAATWLSCPAGASAVIASSAPNRCGQVCSFARPGPIRYRNSPQKSWPRVTLGITRYPLERPAGRTAHRAATPRPPSGSAPPACATPQVPPPAVPPVPVRRSSSVRGEAWRVTWVGP